MDPRRIFVTLDDQGVPQGFAWALVAKPSQFDAGDARLPKSPNAAQATSWACAMSADEEAAGWTATPSEMRRVPEIAQLVKHASANASLTGRTLRCGGVEIDLDERGEPGPAGQEPCCPCGTLVDQGQHQALADAVGRALRFQDKATGNHVTTEPAS